MSPPWASLPLLPLRCVLDHLPTSDALVATTVCRHWRMTLLLYEGHRETLKLHARHLSKSVFLTRIFRKHIKKLHLYLDGSDEDADTLITDVLPQFFDTVNLQEVLFISPSFIQLNTTPRGTKLRRLIAETFLFKHIHSLQNIGLLGCSMDGVKNDNDRYIHKQIEYHSRDLSFGTMPKEADTVLTRVNTTRLMFSNVQHIILSFNEASTETLETLSHLRRLRLLSLTISNRDKMKHIDWPRLQPLYPDGLLDVALNLISLSNHKLEEVMEKVLVEELPLTCLRAMFCKTLYVPLISRVSQLYNTTLREFVWSDAPYDSADNCNRNIMPYGEPQYESSGINPFMLLCWRCDRLRRLAIHGYWVWQYDVVGYVRLRKSLQQLEVSAVYGRQRRFKSEHADTVVRVLASDDMRAIDHNALQAINKFAPAGWSPVPWDELPPGLRQRPTAYHCSQYILDEISRYI